VWWIGNTQLVAGNGASEILVQPVTAAGATSASVSLPAGANWIHYWSGTVSPGGTTVTVAAPIDQEPIFIKAGAIIPMGPALQWVDEKPGDPLTLDIYPAGQTSYSLYEDDGVSNAYLAGAYSTTALACDTSSGRPMISIGAAKLAKYPYAGQLSARTWVLKVNQQSAAPSTVTRDGAPVPMSSAATFDTASEGWYFDAAAKIVWVKFRIATNVATSVSF
jgi:alpha-D-xyloside xylohydrolase